MLGLDHVAAPVAGLESLLAQNVLGLLIQAVPDVAVEHQEVVFIAVAPDGDVGLDFQNAGGVGDAQAVLLAVDGALLQRGEDLAPVQGGGAGAQRGEGILIDGAARSADLEAGQVIGSQDRALGVGELTEAVVERTQQGHVVVGEDLGIVIQTGLVDGGAGVGVVVKDPGGDADGEALVQGAHGDGGVGRDIHGAVGQHLHALGRVAAGQLVIGEDVDQHGAVGGLFDQLGKLLTDLGVDLGVGAVDGHGEVDLGVGARRIRDAGNGQGEDAGQSQNQG